VDSQADKRTSAPMITATKSVRPARTERSNWPESPGRKSGKEAVDTITAVNSLEVSDNATAELGGTYDGWVTARRKVNSFTAKDAKDAREFMRRLFDDGSAPVVDAAMEVHSALGPGLLESAYEACLAHELRSRGHHVATQLPITLVYKGVRVDVGYRADLVVDGGILVELKAVTKIIPVHEAQVISNLRIGGYRVGLLINFATRRLKDGIQRFVNNY
jgi:GxxExxY protein